MQRMVHEPKFGNFYDQYNYILNTAGDHAFPFTYHITPERNSVSTLYVTI